MSALTRREYEILKLIQEADGQASWYRLEIRLSNLDVPREPNLMVCLKELANRGLIKLRVGTESPYNQWELTEAGVQAVESTQ